LLHHSFTKMRVGEADFHALGCAPGAWRTAPKIGLLIIREKLLSNWQKQPRIDAKAWHLRSTGTAGGPSTTLIVTSLADGTTDDFHAPWVRGPRMGGCSENRSAGRSGDTLGGLQECIQVFALSPGCKRININKF